MEWQAAAITVSGSILVAVVGHALHLANRFSVIESQVKDLRDSGDDTEEHGNRLTALESAITDIRNLTNALQTMPPLMSRIEALLENDGRRLSAIENHLFQIPKFRG